MLTPSTVVIDWPAKPYARYADCVPAVLPPTSARGIVIPGVWASRAKMSRWLGMSLNVSAPKVVPTVAFLTSTIGEAEPGGSSPVEGGRADTVTLSRNSGPTGAVLAPVAACPGTVAGGGFCS